MILVPQSKYAAALRSRLLFSFRADPVAGLTALSGQAATFARTVSATGTDAAGASYTAVPGQPAWRWTNGRPGLYLGAETGTVLTFPFLAYARELTIYAAAVDALALSLVSLGLTPFGPPSFAIGRPNGESGLIYCRLNNGSTLTESHMAEAASGSEVEYRAVLYADGSTQLGMSVGGGTEAVAARSSAIGLPSGAWNGSVVRLHPTGGSYDLRRVRAAAGVRTMDQMRGLL